jgi:hypothetical protein
VIFRAAIAGEVDSPRLVRLFDIRIKTTWFIPGHSIATFPLQMQIVANVDHEI